MGKALVIFGAMIATFGLVLWLLGEVPYIGRLPGDIYIRRGSFTFYFPLTTAILISIVLSLLFALMRR